MFCSPWGFWPVRFDPEFGFSDVFVLCIVCAPFNSHHYPFFIEHQLSTTDAADCQRWKEYNRDVLDLACFNSTASCCSTFSVLFISFLSFFLSFVAYVGILVSGVYGELVPLFSPLYSEKDLGRSMRSAGARAL